MISVIMGVYREDPEILLEAVTSILNQNYRDIELIAILDDPQNSQLKKVMNDLVMKDSRIRFYINEENKGLSSTLNRALSLSKGNYIARMDADDIALPCRLEKQMDWLIRNHLDLVGGYLQMIDEKGEPIYSIQKLPISPAKVSKALCFGQVVPHPTWLVKKGVYETLHGYREVPQAEDYDFLIRAVLNGYKCGNIPESILKYRMTAGSVSRTSLYTQYLYMKLLSEAYRKGRIVSQKEITELSKRNPDPIKAKRYAEANTVLNIMLSQLENKSFKGFIGNGICLLFKSPAYLNKIWRLFIQSCLAERN